MMRIWRIIIKIRAFALISGKEKNFLKKSRFFRGGANPQTQQNAVKW
jgi:hypothetical protein